MDLAARIQDYHRRSAPPLGTPEVEEQTFVLVPDSAPGQGYAGLVKKVRIALLVAAAICQYPFRR